MSQGELNVFRGVEGGRLFVRLNISHQGQSRRGAVQLAFEHELREALRPKRKAAMGCPREPPSDEELP